MELWSITHLEKGRAIKPEEIPSAADVIVVEVGESYDPEGARSASPISSLMAFGSSIRLS
ncbi:hypothetical protein BN77_2538 [Rhizobium mesoamericanum STM3625]|uniref:Uncharacterized protein n=1 Tax=Rhizobium mesoamericanum STM3625 TaxID=1211777 RepID=K0PV74_9HYPH|nr:hypothetical protein BN77_2538 [Rhizobium mesoamericanum STM3625]